ncbi:hypothetical protein [Deinococcus sp. UYEF24]
MNTPSADDAHPVALPIRPFAANPIQMPSHIVQYFCDLNQGAQKVRKTVGLLFGQVQTAASGPHFTVCYAMGLETPQFQHDPWPRLQLCDLLTAQEVAWDLCGYHALGYWMALSDPAQSVERTVARLASWIPPGVDISEQFILTVNHPLPRQLDFRGYSYTTRDPLTDLQQLQLDLGVPTAPTTSTITLPDRPKPS